MAARPIWKGQIRLSLVSIPVEMYSATKSGANISFRQIHRPTGKPIHYEKVAEGVGPVDPSDIAKGYEVEKGRYILLSDEEIDEVKLETKKTLELVQFVGACEISPLYFNKPYYLVPSDELAEDAYTVVRDALRESGKIGLGQLSLRGKEYLAAIRPCGDGLLLETLHYADELRKADPMFSEVRSDKAEGDLLEVATALIDRKTAPFDASAYKNNYTAALKQLIAEKAKGQKPVSTNDDESKRSSGSNVVDLMSALKKSLESTGTKANASSDSKSRKSSSRKKKSA